MTATGSAIPHTGQQAADELRVLRKAFRWMLVLALLIGTILYVVWTWRWPLLGDCTLFHYIAFLMDHGMAPYRNLPDMNFPGAFLSEWLVIHTYGGGSLAWRLFDFSLLLAMGAGLIAVARPYDWLAGFFAAVVMMLAHGRDGIYDTGQRDLTIAALVVIGYVFLFRARRKDEAWAAGVFGFCMAAAGTIKPTTLPLMILLPAFLAAAMRREGRSAGRMLAWSVAGMAVPLAAVWIFLLREKAVGAFVHSLTTLEPYFASLGRRPLVYLLNHSVSPLMPLVAIWMTLLIGSAIRNRSWRRWGGARSVERWERAALVSGVLVALGGYIAQGKAFPYQRYPFLVLLLLLMGLDLTAALRKPGFELWLAVLGLGFGSLFLVPQSLVKVKRYDWRNQQYVSLMDADLEGLGGSQLSGHIQCMDTTTGCSQVFYNLRLVSETGMLSDFLVFGRPQAAEVRVARAEFLPQIEARPPWVMVVTGGLFPKGPADFRKLQLWPAFDEFLSEHYRQCVQRTPTKMVDWGGGPPEPPASYRIYVLRGDVQQTARCGELAAAGH